MGKLYFIGFLFSWFKWTMKAAKIRTLRLIRISQFLPSFAQFAFYCKTQVEKQSFIFIEVCLHFIIINSFQYNTGTH